MPDQAHYDAVIAERIRTARERLKASRLVDSDIPAEFRMSDEKKKLPAPALEHAIPDDARVIPLPAIDAVQLDTMTLMEVLRRRRSRREYTDEPLSLEELSFLCWSVAGVHKIGPDAKWAKRTPPSSGARHPFETYVIVERVTGIASGVYRYSGTRHALALMRGGAGICAELAETALQKFIRDSAALFVWTAVPYRSEYRYLFAGVKSMSIDIGHYCQNLYLAAESIGAGTCAITWYDQQALDACLGVDGEDEFTIYLAPVGRLAPNLE